ncbi:MAG TPA: 1-acyl-sn-glycerol-3-phosphate acyltransferase [Spirochaetia bacterium]|nr:1-acyl-sn-glycerol-3-phosphate acyltransferase [Spirochaetia bacterium]
MKPFITAYKDEVKELVRNASQDAVVTPKNVFQEGRKTNKPLIKKIVNELLLTGSGIEGYENLVELYRHAQEGKTCLLLMQHMSNFDIPNWYELLERQGPEGEKIAEAIISIAGLKLNEENDLVRSFTEAFTRIVIFPSSALKGIEDPEELKEAKSKRMSINMAALWQIMRMKSKGHIILVFPTGTRYRPWDPSTKRGLIEVYPYIKSFNYMVLVSINGNTLRLNPNGKMEEDLATEDVVIYSVSKVYACKDYRHELVKNEGHHPHQKQYVIDYIMAELDHMHDRAEPKRKKLLSDLGRTPDDPAAG